MRSDARENRQDLLEAAETLLHEQGPGVSLRAVAQAAGVGVGTLYRHFPTRRHLVTALQERILRRVRQIVADYLGAGGAVPPRERWMRFARELAAVNLSAAASALDSLDSRHLPDEELLQAAKDELIGLMDAVVEHARHHGLVQQDVDGGRFFVGLLTVTRPLVMAQDRVPEGQRDWMIEVYLRGLCPE